MTHKRFDETTVCKFRYRSKNIWICSHRHTKPCLNQHQVSAVDTWQQKFANHLLSLTLFAFYFASYSKLKQHIFHAPFRIKLSGPLMHFLTFAAFHQVDNKRACIECDGTKFNVNYFWTSSTSGCKEYCTVRHLLKIRLNLFFKQTGNK